MARNDDVTCGASVWTQLTNSDTTAVRVRGSTGYPLILQGTVGAVAPSSHAGSIALPPGQILTADLTLAQLFPGVAGVNRLYAYSQYGESVSVSHA